VAGGAADFGSELVDKEEQGAAYSYIEYRTTKAELGRSAINWYNSLA
jgi:hypothetical protein